MHTVRIQGMVVRGARAIVTTTANLPLQNEIEELQPYADVPDSAYDAMPSTSQAHQAALWKTAKYITEEALDCQEEHKDENAWSFNVIRPVFEWETSDGATSTGSAFSRTEFM